MKHNKYLIANDPATKIPDHYAILTNGNYYFMRFPTIVIKLIVKPDRSLIFKTIHITKYFFRFSIESTNKNKLKKKTT